MHKIMEKTANEKNAQQPTEPKRRPMIVPIAWRSLLTLHNDELVEYITLPTMKPLRGS